MGFKLVLRSFLVLLTAATFAAAVWMAVRGMWILAATMAIMAALLIWESVNLKRTLAP